MNLLIRLIWVTLFSRFRKPVSILGPCLTPFRCAPTDLDVLLHMNNGKYFSIQDLARVDLMIRSQVLSKLSVKGWYPVVVAETIRFRKSLQLFDSFQVETSILGWDEKAFVLRHRFLKADVCMAESVVRARFLKKSGGAVAPHEVLDVAGLTSLSSSPALPDWVRDWNANQLA